MTRPFAPSWYQRPGVAAAGAARAGAPLSGRSAWVGDVPIGWCRMRPDDDGDLVLLVELGNAFPRVTQGHGGWDEVEVPGRTSITHWKGHAPIGVDLELFFDDLDAGRSVEGPLEVLDALAGRGRKRKTDRPPVLKVDTGGVMPYDWHQFPDTRWVINGLDFDAESVIRNDHGNRVRQGVTVALLQHVDDAHLRSASAAAHAAGARKRAKTYKTKTGDTLMTIARDKLGTAARWRDIQKLNPSVRDPRRIKAGTTLRLS
jgi:hypothetical protein